MRLSYWQGRDNKREAIAMHGGLVMELNLVQFVSTCFAELPRVRGIRNLEVWWCMPSSERRRQPSIHASPRLKPKESRAWSCAASYLTHPLQTIAISPSLSPIFLNPFDLHPSYARNALLLASSQSHKWRMYTAST